MKFNELKVGESFDLSVIFKNASAKFTRGGKPYLFVELFDGIDSLSGNYWDWKGVVIPTVNTAVYKVTGVISEYQGTKQVTVNSIATDNLTSLSSFIPSSGKDKFVVYGEAFELLTNMVTDDFLRDTALTALEYFKERWLSVPAATGVHHAYEAGTLIHSLSVARIAYAVSKEIPTANPDLCLVGGMLHDLGKLRAYGIEGAGIIMTDTGKLEEHAVIGVDLLSRIAPTCKSDADMDKYYLLRHIILSHHGTLEFGAVIEPQCIEAIIVNLADNIDAKTEMINEASKKTEDKWTGKIWALNNRQMLSSKYVSDLFKVTSTNAAQLSE